MLHLTDCPEPTSQAALAVGDIVAFRFPSSEDSDATPAARPCLVLAVEDDLCGKRALLAYGTAHLSRGNRPLEITLLREAADSATGRPRLTRFICTRRIWAPVDDPAFGRGPDRDTPILDRLDGQPRARLAEVLTQLPRRAGNLTDCHPMLERSYP